MFNLLKDLEKYKGVPPYASELYGMYQPLLGWQSNLTRKWIQRAGVKYDPRIKKVLDANLVPGPQTAHHRDPVSGGGTVLGELYFVSPMEAAKLRRDFKVLVTRDFSSEFLQACRALVETFVEDHNGKLPTGTEWSALFTPEKIVSLLNVASEAHVSRLRDVYRETLHAHPGGHPQLMADLLDAMKYESQIAGLIAAHSSSGGLNPDRLQSLFVVLPAPSLDDLLRGSDPLADVDPKSTSGALSPVGFVHLFRQYFFDLGTFLGEPVEHVWLAPGTTMELVEVSTRRTLIERSVEEASEVSRRAERGLTMSDELSNSVKEQNENSTKLGVSQTNTVNLYVYQGTVSADFSVESTRSQAREAVHKQTRESTEKLSSEIKQNFKSVFKTVTETTDSTSRRLTITNPDRRLINYELRRKMRRVGVQVQDIGARMCWQVFVDDPGALLGLAEMVDLIESAELANLKEPDKIPAPNVISEKVIVPIPFLPILDYNNNNAQYEYAYLEPAGGRYAGKHLSKIMGVDDEDDRDDQTVMGPFRFAKVAAQTNYELSEVRLLNVQGNKIADIRDRKVLDKVKGEYELTMQRIHYGGENVINLEMELIYAPTAAEFARIEAANKTAAEKYDAEKQRLLRQAYLENVRRRINEVSEIRPRPSSDLREEERTVIYRKLIERLMLDSWKLPDTDQNRRLSHVRSEVIRTLFDVDSMLYFVAPEWWMPRRRRGQLDLDIKQMDQAYSLSADDSFGWGGERRPDNYKITNESKPARLGASLGWLLQLDGDNLRNSFLNAPWVKAVIPIRPGRERAALNWLRDGIERTEGDGWDAPYLGTEAEFADKSIGEVLETVAERLEAQNENIEHVLEADKVFEHGFDHLGKGFDAGVEESKVFSQWISVLPTDQIAAVEYQPTSFDDPP